MVWRWILSGWIGFALTGLLIFTAAMSVGSEGPREPYSTSWYVLLGMSAAWLLAVILSGRLTEQVPRQPPPDP